MTHDNDAHVAVNLFGVIKSGQANAVARRAEWEGKRTRSRVALHVVE